VFTHAGEPRRNVRLTDLKTERREPPEKIQDTMRPQGRRVLHLLDRAGSRPVVAVVVVTANLAWVLVSVGIGFPSRLEAICQMLVAALTLALVFVIPHTSAWEQVVGTAKVGRGPEGTSEGG